MPELQGYEVRAVFFAEDLSEAKNIVEGVADALAEDVDSGLFGVHLFDGITEATAIEWTEEEDYDN